MIAVGHSCPLVETGGVKSDFELSEPVYPPRSNRQCYAGFAFDFLQGEINFSHPQYSVWRSVYKGIILLQQLVGFVLGDIQA